MICGEQPMETSVLTLSRQIWNQFSVSGGWKASNWLTLLSNAKNNVTQQCQPASKHCLLCALTQLPPLGPLNNLLQFAEILSVCVIKHVQSCFLTASARTFSSSSLVVHLLNIGYCSLQNSEKRRSTVSKQSFWWTENLDAYLSDPKRSFCGWVECAFSSASGVF